MKEITIICYNCEERKISKAYQRNENMNEMKEILIDKLNAAFWNCMSVRIYFINELLSSELYIQALELAEDINDLIEKLYVNFDLHNIKKSISVYEKVDDLLTEVTLYLYKKYGIDYNEELANRKQ